MNCLLLFSKNLKSLIKPSLPGKWNPRCYRKEMQLYCSPRIAFQNGHLSHGFLCQFQYANCQSSSMYVEKDSIIKRFKKRVFTSYSDSSKVKISAMLVYEKCADGIDWNEFSNFFKMPDTFQSWFLALQLHIWMCVLVTVPEKYGRTFRNSLVDAMWNDVELRLDQLTEIQKSKKKAYLTEVLNQFQASLISYDEGILGTDTTLASAAWRTLFDFRPVDPRLLECIVMYIRKQICHLDSLNIENMILHGHISFLPLSEVFQSKEEKL